MTTQTISDPLEPVWWKQFWPWFLMSFPATAVIAGIITFNLAVNSYDGLVTDDYYKKGLAIYKDVNAIQQAHQLGIEATINFDTANNRVTLDLQSKDMGAFGALQLALSHPTQAGHDSLIELQAIGPNRYQGSLPKLPINYWNLQLIAKEAGWRLSSRLDLGKGRQIVLK